MRPRSRRTKPGQEENLVKPGIHRKSVIFAKKGLKEGERVTGGHFRWVKPLYINCLSALDLPQNPFPFSRTGHLKVAGGPNQIIYSKF